MEWVGPILRAFFGGFLFSKLFWDWWNGRGPRSGNATEISDLNSKEINYTENLDNYNPEGSFNWIKNLNYFHNNFDNTNNYDGYEGSDMFFCNCDAAEPWQIGIQDPATPNLEGMIFFHNYLCFYLIAIVVFVCWLLGKIIVSYNDKSNPKPSIFVHSSILEIVWTIIPAIILLIIAVPSFALLYSIDELIDPLLTLKVVGHQWYWSYEYSDFVTLEGGESLDFDSYMIATDELSKGSFRLLEVDNRVVLPTNTHIRVLITAADVLHSWCVPSFGIKVDACPGRLTQASLFIKREGVYYGQCSEICGVNHGFMPIVVRALSKDNFVKWVTAKLDGVTLS